jgi:uncharacterized protein involved in outer membrane biogenesis
MKPAGKRAFKIVTLALLFLAALTVLAPTLLSTGPGRHVAETIAAARLHRTVHVERLDFGWTTGVYIEKLTISERLGFGTEPFLTLDTLHCPNSLLALLGHGQLKETALDGLAVNIARLEDGRLSIGDLTGQTTRPAAQTQPQNQTASAPSAKRSPPTFAMPFRLTGAKLTFTDSTLATEALLTDCSVTGSYEAGLVTITGSGRLNNGDLVFSGHLDRRAAPAPFDLAAALKNAKASNRTSALGYQAPILYNPTGLTTGTFDLDVKLAGRGLARADLAANLAGESHLRVRDLRLEKSKFLAKLAKALPGLKIEDPLELGDLTSDSTIGGGRITSPDIELVRQGDPLLILSGWSDFATGGINYKISSKSKKLEKVEPFAALVDLRLVGTLQDPKVEFGLAGKDTTIDVKKMIDLFKKPKKTPPPAP